MDYQNPHFVKTEKLEPIPYPKEFLKLYQEKIGCDKDLRYFVNKEAWGFFCPSCCSPILRGDVSCPKCGIDKNILEKACKADMEEAYSAWAEETRKKKEIEAARLAKEARRKKEAEDAARKKRNKICTITFIAVSVVIFVVFFYYSIFIKPEKDKAETFKKYSQASYTEKVAMYEQMVKYGYDLPTVSFYDGKERISSVSAMPGKAIPYPTDFDSGDWTFLGWELSGSNTSNSSVNEHIMGLESRRYTAILVGKITYVDVDGTSLSTQSFYKSDSTVTLANDFSSKLFTGIKVIGWTDEKTGKSYSVNEEIENPGASLTLKAVIALPVKILDTDNKTLKYSSIKYGESYTIPDWDESVGYIGWSYKNNLDAIHTERTIEIKDITDIVLRSKYKVTYKNTLTNTEETGEFTLDKGVTITAEDLKEVNGYFGLGFELNGTLYRIGSTLKPTENITLDSVYKKSVSYGSSSNATICYVDTVAHAFYKSLDEVKDTENIIRVAISYDYFSISSNGEICLSDQGEKNARQIEYLYIPDILNGRKVVSLGTNAFLSCTALKAVRIPESVTKYGSNVFSNSLSLVIESLDLTKITSIGAKAFANTTIKEIITAGTSLYSYSSPSQDHPFYSVKGFEKLTIIAGCTTLSNLMSSSMKKTVKSTNIPDSVTKFSDSVFEDCVNLKIEISLSPRVTSIGDYAFKNSGITFTSVDLSLVALLLPPLERMLSREQQLRD